MFVQCAVTLLAQTIIGGPNGNRDIWMYKYEKWLSNKILLRTKMKKNTTEYLVIIDGFQSYEIGPTRKPYA